MEELLKSVVSHNDIGIHVIGWMVAAIIAMFTLLYKGVWKAINILRVDQDDCQQNLDRLIGEHIARHNLQPWDGADRRRNPR